MTKGREINLPVTVPELVAMPMPDCLLHMEAMEEQYIRSNIQKRLERELSKDGEHVDCFEVRGEGFGKYIVWTIFNGEECDGCEGDGRIYSNRGTSVECPDCDGDGLLDGDGSSYEFVTDYDGNAITEKIAA